jgi:hypothetical protein
VFRCFNNRDQSAETINLIGQRQAVNSTKVSPTLDEATHILAARFSRGID